MTAGGLQLPGRRNKESAIRRWVGKHRKGTRRLLLAAIILAAGSGSYQYLVYNGKKGSALSEKEVYSKAEKGATALEIQSGRLPIWNAWIENSGPKIAHNPVRNLKPAQDYIIGIDLAAIAYQTQTGNVSSEPARSSLRNWLDSQTDPQVSLNVLVVPDAVSFTASARGFVSMTINRAAMEKYFTQYISASPPADAMADLRQNPAPSYLFGSLDEPLKVHTATREGFSYFAVSFWSGIQPIDSIVVRVCISESDAPGACGADQPPVVSEAHLDRLNVGAPDPSTETPAASLHFIEVPGHTIAVLQAGEAAPVSWQIDASMADLESMIRDQLTVFGTATNDQSILDTGEGLFEILVPREQPRARAAIQQLLADQGRADSVPPLIWVRVDPRDPRKIFPVPLALATVNGKLLGESFRIQSILPREDYRTVEGCIADWKKLLPPADSGFGDAQTLMARRIKNGTQDDFSNNLHNFAGWIGDTSPLAEPVVLLTLSHYFSGGIGFNQNDWIPAANIARPLSPSVAIIEGCDGAQPGGDLFVQYLNRAGIQSVVTTNGPIQPLMAGQYFDALNAALDRKPESLSQAHFEAVQSLKAMPRSLTAGAAAYGLRAYMFTLLGDGNAKLCGLKKL